MATIKIHKGPDGKAKVQLLTEDQPTAEVVQCLPGAGIIVLKVPGYASWTSIGESAYQPVSYEVYAVDEIVEKTDKVHTMRVTRIVSFDARGTELWDRVNALTWRSYSEGR